MKPDNVDALVENMRQSLAWISVALVADRYEVSLLQLKHIFEYIDEEMVKWRNTMDGTWKILQDTKSNKKYIYDSCSRIPFSHLLYLAKIKAGKSCGDPQLKKYLQMGYILMMYWLDTVMKQHYRINLEKRKEFCQKMVDWIDTCARGFMKPEDLNNQFIEDYGYDMVKGQMVE